MEGRMKITIFTIFTFSRFHVFFTFSCLCGQWVHGQHSVMFYGFFVLTNCRPWRSIWFQSSTQQSNWTLGVCTPLGSWANHHQITLNHHFFHPHAQLEPTICIYIYMFFIFQNFIRTSKNMKTTSWNTVPCDGHCSWSTVPCRDSQLFLPSLAYQAKLLWDSHQPTL